MRNDTELANIKQALDEAISLVQKDSAWLKPTDQNLLVDQLKQIEAVIEEKYAQQ